MIQLKNITKLYEMGGQPLTALDDISLTIHNGDFTSIMGPSGSGKSTLMNIVGLLDEFDGGEYILNDINIGDYSEREVAGIRNKEIGFIFQSFNLLPRMNLLENVMLPLVYAGMPLKERKKKGRRSAGQSGLSQSDGSSP